MLFIILAVSLCTGARGDQGPPQGPQQHQEEGGSWLDTIFSFVTGPTLEVPGMSVERSGGGPEHYETAEYSFSTPEASARLFEGGASPPKTPHAYAGRPVALPPRTAAYGHAVRPAVEGDTGGGFSKFIGGILPNSYYSRPKFRYPYYDSTGKGYLLYGYGGKELYEYSVFKPLEGYF